LFSFCSAGDWTQGLTLAKQALELCTDIMPHVENSTPDLMWQVPIEVLGMRSLFKITCRLWVWGAHERQMNCVFRFGSAPKISHSGYTAIPKSKNVWNQKHLCSRAFRIRDTQPGYIMFPLGKTSWPGSFQIENNWQIVDLYLFTGQVPPVNELILTVRAEH
jgi:hypothetical protein